jgi:hypothetical protein
MRSCLVAIAIALSVLVAGVIGSRWWSAPPISTRDVSPHLRRPGAERFETAGKPSARKAAPSVGRMQRMPEAGIRPDQVPQIIEAFRTLSGQN